MAEWCQVSVTASDLGPAADAILLSIRYSGSFVNDQLCGMGKFDSIDGTSFSGSWQGETPCCRFCRCNLGGCLAQEMISSEMPAQYMQMAIDILAKFEACVGTAEAR
jgi:hypothetical protein